MFPTHVGMNRSQNEKNRTGCRVPHACGDEPMSVDAETAKALNEIKDLTIQVKSLKTFIIVDAATEPALGTIRQLEQTVMNVEAVMKIKIDASQALAAIRALERPTSSVHTVYVKDF